MKLSIKSFMPLAAGSLLGLASCSQVENRAKNYINETNRSQAEYENIVSGDISRIKQSRLDSLAFRDIFNSTEAAKDSAKVEEFNKIASRIRQKPEKTTRWSIISSIDNNLIQEGISTEELKNIRRKTPIFQDDLVRINMRQHYADSWAYKNFFKKIGIMNDSINKKCNEVSKKIRP